jgi:NO-binding membrane sensor protein with MHYT domain
MTVGSVVPQEFNLVLVALSYFVSVLGSLSALECAIQIPRPDGGVRWGYVLAGAVALGGVAIWSMHFIGMTALHTQIEVEYDALLTLLSLVAAVLVSALALWFVGRGRFTLTKLVVSGALAGVGVAVMHYMGMAAMRMNALIRWDTGIVALSVVIAMAAAIVALWLAFNLKATWQRSLAALAMGVAVCGMHYTGMAAGTFVCTERKELTGSAIGGADLPIVVFVLALMILGAIGVHMILAWEPYQAGSGWSGERFTDAR